MIHQMRLSVVVVALGTFPIIGRAPFLPVPALDKNWSPKITPKSVLPSRPGAAIGSRFSPNGCAIDLSDNAIGIATRQETRRRGS